MHIDTYLNELLSFKSHSTRRSSKWLLKIPKFKRKIERNSLRYTGVKLLNQNNVLPSNFNELSDWSLVSVVHKVRDNYILLNN